MRNLLRSSSVIGVTLLFAACQGKPAMDGSMKADLDAAAAGTIELAPMGAGTSVVSALETRNPVQPTVTPVRETKLPARTPPPETPQVVQAESPEPAATRPISTPAVNPPPPGGYKTVNEVIRNAPFPIKPLTKSP